MFFRLKYEWDRITNAIEGLGIFGRFILNLMPIIRILLLPVILFLKVYRKLWDRFAYKTYWTALSDTKGFSVGVDANMFGRDYKVLRIKRNGKILLRGPFSKLRAFIFTWFTVLLLSTFTDTYIGDVVRFWTVEPISDGLLMATTYRTDTYYLNTTEEIDPIASTHSVQGCYHAAECTEHEAIYFIVKHRLSHDIWKFFKYGNPIYVPGHVVAPIAPGVNKCEVTYYGYKLTTSYIARLLRSMQVYPIMLEANCKFLGLERE